MSQINHSLDAAENFIRCRELYTLWMQRESDHVYAISSSSKNIYTLFALYATVHYLLRSRNACVFTGDSIGICLSSYTRFFF